MPEKNNGFSKRTRLLVNFHALALIFLEQASKKIRMEIISNLVSRYSRYSRYGQYKNCLIETVGSKDTR